jgi:hypothetical protein
LATEQKDGFLDSLGHTVKSSGVRPWVNPLVQHNGHVTKIHRFNVLFSGLDWVPNFEKTRWFLVLRLKAPDGNGLNKLLHVCNIAIQEYGQPSLYAKAVERKKPKKTRGPGKYGRMANRRGSELKMDWSSMQDLSNAFHISIAWTLESPNQYLLDETKSFATEQLGEVKTLAVEVEEIKAKLGNVVTSIPLQKNLVEGKGLFGFWYQEQKRNFMDRKDNAITCSEPTKTFMMGRDHLFGAQSWEPWFIYRKYALSAASEPHPIFRTSKFPFSSIFIRVLFLAPWFKNQDDSLQRAEAQRAVTH